MKHFSPGGLPQTSVYLISKLNAMLLIHKAWKIYVPLSLKFSFINLALQTAF